MKVTYGPIVSSASGRFQGIVATQWKGIHTIRTFRKPSDPSTTDQQNVRIAFTNLNRMFSVMPVETKASWDTFAAGKSFIGRNAFLGHNVSLIQGQADVNDIVMSPGDASTVPPTGITLTPGAGEIAVLTSLGTTPTGWTVVSVTAVLVRSRDPKIEWSPFAWSITESTDLTAPYNATFTGLTAGVDYVVTSFIKYTAPDGTTRYSAGNSDVAQPL